MNPVFPKYIDGLPVKARGIARIKFLVRLAALYATPGGTLRDLSKKLGLHPNTLGTMLSVNRDAEMMPARIAKGIEQLVGREIVPRELLNAEVYGDDNTQSE
jgi:lambda repressor-like predicted transcriptional regulator